MTFDVGVAPFAEYMAVATSIRTDPQGRIRVQRRNADGKADGRIDLVTADGRYIGTLPRLPMPLAVSASGLGAWVVTDDELGAQHVVVRPSRHAALTHVRRASAARLTLPGSALSLESIETPGRTDAVRAGRRRVAARVKASRAHTCGHTQAADPAIASGYPLALPEES